MKEVSMSVAFCYDEAMNLNKRSANIIFTVLLVASLYITWKALGVAGDRAYSGEQPLLWINFVAFMVSVGLVLLAVFVKTKYGR